MRPLHVSACLSFCPFNPWLWCICPSIQSVWSVLPVCLVCLSLQFVCPSVRSSSLFGRPHGPSFQFISPFVRLSVRPVRSSSSSVCRSIQFVRLSLFSVRRYMYIQSGWSVWSVPFVWFVRLFVCPSVRPSIGDIYFTKWRNEFGTHTDELFTKYYFVRLTWNEKLTEIFAYFLQEVSNHLL